MKISFENPDKINGLLTLVVEEEDYKNDVEKSICKNGSYQQARWSADLQVCTGQQYPDAR